jgi:leucine-rich repeat-containing protein 49
MLGKNQISKIEGLDNLKRLDVLDLHSNSIQVIENIGHLLPDLRVLNLAGNKIRQVEGLEGLPCLTEVNLRRNLITKILCDLKKLPVLQRLFLSNNLIEGYSDIQSVLSVSTLVELSLDNNPISQESFYKATILETLPNLKHFDLKKINDDERPNREKKKPIEDQVELDTPITPMTGFIPNVPTQPAVTLSSPVVSLLPSQPPQTSATAIPISSKITPTPPTPTSSTSSSTIKINMQTDKVTSISVLNSQPLALPLSESTVEVTGTELHIYGMQVTSQEIQQAMSANTIESVHLHNLDFNNGFVDLYLPILKTSPKILSNLTFVQNNISNLSQLDRLPCQYVRKLTIRENPVAVMLKRILKPYCIMLCSNLEELNGRAITSQDRSNADKIFGRRNLIMEQHAATAEKQTSYTQNTVSSQYIDSVLAHTYTIDKKMKVIDEEWDSVIDAMIQEAIPQLENMDTHLHQYIDKYIK